MTFLGHSTSQLNVTVKDTEVQQSALVQHAAELCAVLKDLILPSSDVLPVLFAYTDGDGAHHCPLPPVQLS